MLLFCTLMMPARALYMIASEIGCQGRHARADLLLGMHSLQVDIIRQSDNQLVLMACGEHHKYDNDS